MAGYGRAAAGPAADACGGTCGCAHRPRKHVAPARAPHRELDGGLRHDLDDGRQVAAPEPEQAAGRPHLAQRGRQPRIGRVGHHHGAQALQRRGDRAAHRAGQAARQEARERVRRRHLRSLRAHESRTCSVAACLRDALRRHDRACLTTLAPQPCKSARGRQYVGHGAHLRGAPWSRDGTMTALLTEHICLFRWQEIHRESGEVDMHCHTYDPGSSVRHMHTHARHFARAGMTAR